MGFWAVLEAPMVFTFQPPFLAGLSGYVAELGAAFLAADLGLCIEPRPDHASYIASWIKVLQNDTRAIVQAAAHAERAVAYLHQLANPEAIREAA
jgi:antirestriction protein ArdC